MSIILKTFLTLLGPVLLVNDTSLFFSFILVLHLFFIVVIYVTYLVYSNKKKKNNFQKKPKKMTIRKLENTRSFIMNFWLKNF